MRSNSRSLETRKQIEDFIKFTLHYDYLSDTKVRGIIPKIVDSEMGVQKFNEKNQTLFNHEMRAEEHRDDLERRRLRKRIVNELYTLKRLDNDDHIKLGKGGALPQSELRSERKAFVITGLPASGKSFIATQVAEDYGAIMIDSDFAKRKLPEFDDHYYSASIVHEESIQITHGFSDTDEPIKSLYDLCLENCNNIVIPRIGQNPSQILKLSSSLKNTFDYEVHLIHVSLPKKDATLRAINRFAETKRYVPLGLIYDIYGNDPSHCYYYLRCKKQDSFTTMGAISTLNRPAKCIDSQGNSPVLKYENEEYNLILP